MPLDPTGHALATLRVAAVKAIGVPVNNDPVSLAAYQHNVIEADSAAIIAYLIANTLVTVSAAEHTGVIT